MRKPRIRHRHPVLPGIYGINCGDNIEKLIEQGAKLHLKFSGGKWIEFTDNGTNGHQLNAIRAFFASGMNETVVSVPHAIDGTFVATFKATRIGKCNAYRIYETVISDLYCYIPNDGRPPVEFCYALPDKLNMWDNRIAAKWCS